MNSEASSKSSDVHDLIYDRITGFGALIAIVSVAGWSWRTGGFTWSGRNDFPFGHSIYNAGAMLLILPWLAYATIKTKGRHDPCLLPRFVPMAEAMVAIVIADHWLRWKGQLHKI